MRLLVGKFAALWLSAKLDFALGGGNLFRLASVGVSRNQAKGFCCLDSDGLLLFGVLKFDDDGDAAPADAG